MCCSGWQNENLHLRASTRLKEKEPSKLKDLTKKTVFIALILFITLAILTPVTAATNCTESTSLRKGYRCQVSNLAGVVVKSWWACDATYQCSEGTRHKYYCTQSQTSYNDYYYNSGIVDQVQDRNRVIQTCIDRGGSVMESRCRDPYLNWQ